jgi:hypothetical protein
MLTADVPIAYINIGFAVLDLNAGKKYLWLQQKKIG